MAELVAVSNATNSQQNIDLEQLKPDGVQEPLMYKNRLQEFTQRAKIPFPVYQTINEEGPRNPPKFRSTVVVDGNTYTSSNTFPNRRIAEQNVAKIALEGISKRIKECVVNKKSDEGFPPINEDRVFCKSILHEFAVKANFEKPTYNNVKLDGVVPVFVCSLNFNGVTYTGEPSVTKKEAEQLAARAVILSILGDSGAGTLLSEIVKSKAEFFDAVHKRSSPGVGNVSPIVLNVGSDNEASANKERTLADSDQAGNVIENAVPLTRQVQSPDVPGHEFRKPSAETSQPIHLPITFVPACQAQPTLLGLTCGVKRKCKNKKRKANKKVKAQLMNQAIVSDQNLVQAVPERVM